MPDKKVKNVTLDTGEHFLEEAILKYQQALAGGTEYDMHRTHEKIVRIYNPKHYIGKWQHSYRDLYPNYEDFENDYYELFRKAITRWKPRDQRKASRYQGSGKFQNYFWGILQHHYSNKVKADAALKRNVVQQCPICNAWCNPLSTHLLEKHQELLWQKMSNLHVDLSTATSCPFCNTFKPSKNSDDSEKHLKQHMLISHSTLLFEYFHEIFPDRFHTKGTKFTPFSSLTHPDEHIVQSTGQYGKLEHLINLQLSPVQESMIERVLNNTKPRVIKWDNSYNCSEQQFEDELRDLQNKMRLVDMDG